ncbi:MAG: OPT/YSL family transporter, partial [Lachnospiraceae bacterium]|nr:OPT/YSL family transporter [Lachnospiraceae bacterium]
MSQSTNTTKYANSFSQQFTLRGIIIGIIGAIILTMSSMFIALKLSSLPWPIMFVALVSMFSLKACGNTNFNEINVTHTIMSAGSMVAGGLAFTLPGIWMLNP